MTKARILTTHAGSLPRPAALTELFTRRAQGEMVDEEALVAAGREAVASVVAKQRAIGLDVVSNGEQQRESLFSTCAAASAASAARAIARRLPISRAIRNSKRSARVFWPHGRP